MKKFLTLLCVLAFSTLMFAGNPVDTLNINAAGNDTAAYGYTLVTANDAACDTVDLNLYLVFDTTFTTDTVAMPVIDSTATFMEFIVRDSAGTELDRDTVYFNDTIPFNVCFAGDTVYYQYVGMFDTLNKFMYNINVQCIHDSTSTAVENVAAVSKYKVVTSFSTVIINGCTDELITVYDAAGRAVRSTKARCDAMYISGLKSGVYFIKIGNEIIKTVVRE